MKYGITTTTDFERALKTLCKKYHSLIDDFEAFKKELIKDPYIGDDLGGNVRKIRLAIKSKNKGKSGGARVISYNLIVDIENTNVVLLTIYDKNVQGSISKKEINQLKKGLGLI
jgi:hypothetical protein